MERDRDGSLEQSEGLVLTNKVFSHGYSIPQDLEAGNAIDKNVLVSPAL